MHVPSPRFEHVPPNILGNTKVGNSKIKWCVI